MPRLIDHIDLRVRSLRVSGPFYRELLPALGFTVRVEIPDWIQFEAPGDGPAEFIGVTEDPDHRPNHTRLAFWAESPERVRELAALIEQLGASDIEGPDFETPDYYAVFFDDPSGNPLEICHRARRFDATPS